MTTNTASQKDAALILRCDAGIMGKAKFVNFGLSDVTGDGVVDDLDAAKILKFDAGLIKGF